MSKKTLPEDDAGRTLVPAYIDLTIFPRMEATGKWIRRCVPVGDGWHDSMVKTLAVTRVKEVGRRDRWTKKGNSRQDLKAKNCAPGIAPFLLRAGDRRCKRDVLALDQWTHLPLDFDAVSLTVAELMDITSRAYECVRRFEWTTWSCADGYASLRDFLVLSRVVTLDELATLWWWARRTAIDAGLPEASAKPREPSLDPRLNEGLFYLPAVPTPMVVGTEKWGGVTPRGYVSPDGTPLLDVDAVLPEARRIRAADEPAHLAAWPGVPLPGDQRRVGGARAVASREAVGSRASGNASEVAHEDFATVAFADTTLLAWAERTLALGTEASVGSPWRPDGGSGEAGKSLRIHRELDGRSWAKDFVTGIVHVHASAAGQGPTPVEGLDDIVDAVLGVEEGEDPAVLTEADQLLRARDYGGVMRLIGNLDAPSTASLRLLGVALAEDHEDEEEAKRKAALSFYAERLAKKKAKAESIDPRLVEGAKAAMKFASTIVAAIGAGLRKQGMPSPDPTKPCGLAIGTHHALSGKLSVGRLLCRTTSCPTCSAVSIARKVGAVLHMPITSRETEDEPSRVVGDPMGARPVWVYRIAAVKVASFLQRWNRASVGNSLSVIKKKEGPIENFRHSPTRWLQREEKRLQKERDREEERLHHEDLASFGAHAYAAFHLRDQQVVILSTFEVPVRKGQPPLLGERHSADGVEALVTQLGSVSYRVAKGDEELGTEATVVGRITSSHGLTLDPAEVARIAAASAWMSLGRADAAGVARMMKARKVAYTQEVGEGQVVKRVTSSDYVSPEAAVALIRDGTTPPTSEPSPFFEPNLSDVDGILAELESA